MREVKVSQFDFCRIVRTELLPYEVPYRFSFDCLAMNAHPIFKNLKLLEDLNQGSTKIRPLQFQILKNPLGSDVRTLTVMPPTCAILWREFYEDYNQAILAHCNRSPWSLRYPARIAKVFTYKSTFWNTTQEPSESSADQLGEHQSAELESITQVHDQNAISSFFSYARHNSLYQFYNSPDLKRLERSFSSCIHIDVANCFNSIYSHSISWAVRGKEKAKATADKRGNFDSRFDFLMRSSNYGETAGIPIGPEISRIFAEVILQRCDVEIEQALQERGLSDRKEYTIRRYIDDFFVFSNLSHHRDMVVGIIKESLSRYNLHLNEMKSKPMIRPFVSSISICKKRISNAVREMFPDIATAQVYSQSVAQARASKFIDEVRQIASENHETFKPLVPFTLGILKNLATKALRKSRSPELHEASLNRIIEVLCATEDLIGMCLNYRTSVLLSEILFNVTRGVTEQSSTHGETIASFSRSILYRCLTSLTEAPIICRADFFNILIASRDLGCNERLPFSDFRQIARCDSRLNQLTGIDLCVALYYYGGSPEHATSAEEVLEIAIDRIIDCQDIAADAELSCLALDLLCCPYITSSQEAALISKLDPNNELDARHWGRLKKQEAFFSWQADRSPNSFLQKKTLSFGY